MRTNNVKFFMVDYSDQVGDSYKDHFDRNLYANLHELKGLYQKHKEYLEFVKLFKRCGYEVREDGDELVITI